MQQSQLSREQAYEYLRCRCFISYNHEDEGFAKRLHSRMSDEQLQVRFLPKDTKCIERIPAIPLSLLDSIRQELSIADNYKQQLLVLSEASMNREWVAETIVETRQQERENWRILFPIRLVDIDTLNVWNCVYRRRVPSPDFVDPDSGDTIHETVFQHTDCAGIIRERDIHDFSNWEDDDEFEKQFKKLLDELEKAAAVFRASWTLPL